MSCTVFEFYCIMAMGASFIGLGMLIGLYVGLHAGHYHQEETEP